MATGEGAGSVMRAKDGAMGETTDEAAPVTNAAVGCHSSAENAETESSRISSEPNSKPRTSDLASLTDVRQEAKDALYHAIQKVEDLSGIGDLRQEISRLREAAASINKHQCVPPAKDEESSSPAERERKRPCKVERLTMELWESGEFSGSGTDEQNAKRVTAPVIQVFYQNIPRDLPEPHSMSSDDDFKNAHTAMQQGGEKPQRVQINSASLISELKQVTTLDLESAPTQLIPPFKILLHSWEPICSTLQRLKVESANRSCPEESDARLGETRCNTAVNRQTPTTPGDTPDDEDKLRTRIAHLQCLVDFIKTDLGFLLGLKLKIKERSLAEIAFEELPHLFTPGDLVINRKNRIDQLHQVYATTGGRIRWSRDTIRIFAEPNPNFESDTSPDASLGTWTDFVVQCFRSRWDGAQIGPVRQIHRFSRYIGLRKIQDLDFYPLSFREDPEKTYEALVLRGRKFLSCLGHKSYDGPTIASETATLPFILSATFDKYDMVGNIQESGRHFESDIFVDFLSFYAIADKPSDVFSQLRRVRPASREVAETTRQLNYDFIGDHEVDDLQSDQFLQENFDLTIPSNPDRIKGTTFMALLPHSLPAYAFRTRRWVWVEIDKIGEINKSKEAKSRAWEDLVIHEGYSELLLSLVDNHITPAGYKQPKVPTGHLSSTAQIDIIKGKGRALIILLHGPPGTGKTSTAEAIAAYTAKPLYAITCGDIGLQPAEVERNLVSHMKLAEKWSCVLLLDEADVFLARRGWTDMTRNALVSVFLRQLEYYSGILFLTTNIVGLIDEAFKSRIHIALRYDVFDWPATERIWKNLLARIKKDSEASDIMVDFNEEALLKFARTHHESHEGDESTWNARQIRNAFSSVIAMGQHDRLERVTKQGMTPEEAVKSGKRSLTTVKLTCRNFSKIAETADDFEKYIKRVRGDDAENALVNKQRDDSYGRQVTPQRKAYQEHSDDFAPPARRRAAVSSSATKGPSSMLSGRKVRSKWHGEGDDQEGEGEGRTRRKTGPPKAAVFADDYEDEDEDDDDDDDDDE